ncbi:DUF2505 domain-containing protein [Paraoerskovia marina]|uniref:DUF2505 domain-containing protein n=1 Tax=Paraoerskovia marina TaxID=545619 RepID=UPI001E5CE84D|nr:DUF2505 domain-containing protein [Paraoerskovia marina]
MTSTYPAPVAEVAAMLAAEPFVRWRAGRTSPGGTVDQADVSGSLDGGFTSTVRRTVPTTDIPSQVRSFVGDHVEIRQVEVWEPGTASPRGTVTLEITGAPIRLTGTVRLEDLPDGGTAQTYDGVLRAAVPLFASTIEKAAAQAVRDALSAEEVAGREWLTAP